MGMYFSGETWIEMSTGPGVVSGTPTTVPEGVAGVVSGVAMRVVSTGVEEGIPADGSIVQPVNRIVKKRINPGRRMKCFMEW